MRPKTTIRYERFRSSEDGGRIFDFWIMESQQPNRAISIEIPATFFEGEDRLHLQDGVGISYAKVRNVLELTDPLPEAPQMLRLTAADLAMHRVAPPVATKRPAVAA